MKPLRDSLGRPIQRLYFKTEVLDARCEGIIKGFMERRSGGFRLPIPTDELTRLIEEEADDLDLYAQLPDGVEGLTDFFADRRPKVRIAESLYRTRSDHRLRTTLAHEFGHVDLHAPLWRRDSASVDGRPTEPSWTCARDTIVDAPENDWMEWQAGYVCGALLMPASAVRDWVQEFVARSGAKPAFAAESTPGTELISIVAKRCDVSDLAARIRLLKLGIVSES
jgi:IrrE N-terminal-like domain